MSGVISCGKIKVIRNLTLEKRAFVKEKEMSIHEQNPEMKPDSLFDQGDFTYLVEGNICRLLDGRRTPGVIEQVDCTSGMFTWRITAYEDKGNSWTLPFSEVCHYQFLKGAVKLNGAACERLEAIDDSFDKTLFIAADERRYNETEAEIKKRQIEAETWLAANAVFQEAVQKFDFEDFHVLDQIAKVFQAYMKRHNLLEMEQKTSRAMVLNPNSGEWFKGMKVVLAELGLAPCYDKGIRTRDLFEGLGSKANRKKYIVYRLAFVRALFKALDMERVLLYRGMASEGEWRNVNRTLLNMTFKQEVAESFAALYDDKFSCAYVMKARIKVEALFMTYIETAQMNERYKEREGVVLCQSPMWL